MEDAIKNTAIISAGYEYQTYHGILILCDWLDNPSRYERIRFECDDEAIAPQGLDDIVAEKKDGFTEYLQVKYTPAPDKHLLTFEWLLEKTGKTDLSRSNLKKWYDALRGFENINTVTAKLITNRRPDRAMETCLHNCFVNFSSISSAIKTEIINQLGSEENARWFFKNFYFEHSQKSYASLKCHIEERLQRHTDGRGVYSLQVKAKEWSIQKAHPYPEGWITLGIIQRIISTKTPAPISQDFSIPEGYEVPDEEFHQDFLKLILDPASEEQTIFLKGAPGLGKSTYLSYVCNVLEEEKIPVIRHHYFLSQTDRTQDRYSSYIVEHSLLAQIKRLFPDYAESNTESKLLEGITRCAEYFQNQGKPLVVIIDGLDHVWRENSSDIRPLDDLLRQILPPVKNLRIILGTQPISEEQLPKKLSQCTSICVQKELPPMAKSSVHNYLLGQIKEQRLNLLDGADSMDLANAMHNKTHGYPLYVIYATEQLVNLGKKVSSYDLDTLQGDISEDINEYYRSLWRSLTDTQRDVLSVVSAFSFHWPLSAFAENSLLNFKFHDLEQVRHLLYSSDIGIAPFHNSLVVFVNGDDSYCNRMARLRPLVSRWLEQEAPEHLRNMWLWLVQAELGDASNLINSLSRKWIIDHLSEGYDLDHVEYMLSQALMYALKEKRYADGFRLNNLRNRVSNSLVHQLHDGLRLQVCSWILGQDELIIRDANIAGQTSSPSKIAGIGYALSQRNYPREADNCAKRSLKRYLDDVKWRSPHHRSNTDDDKLFHKFFGLIYSLRTAGLAFVDDERNVQFNEELDNYLVGAIKKGDIDDVFYLHGKSKSNIDKKNIENAAIRLAVQEEIHLTERTEFDSFGSSYLSQCTALLINKNELPIKISSLPESWLFSPHNAELHAFLHDYFFSMVFAKIQGNEKNQIEIQTTSSHYRQEFLRFIKTLESTANTAAQHWQTGNFYSFKDFYSSLTHFHAPKNAPRELGSYYDFTKGLLQVAIDCHLLSGLLCGSRDINLEDLQFVIGLEAFNKNYFVSHYARISLRLLSDEAAWFILQQLVDGHKNISMTNEYASKFLDVCEVCLLHGDLEKAKKYCAKAWEAALGYGWHKDMSLIYALTALEHLEKTVPAATAELLYSLAPQVHNIEDYTDGDETRYAHDSANSLLAKLAPETLVKKYAEHLEQGDWSNAEKALAARFEHNLDSVYLDALARTGLPQEALSVLSVQANQGNARAQKLYQVAVRHNGNGFTPEKDRYSSRVDNPPPLTSYAEFPPNKYGELRTFLSEQRLYSAYDYLPRWFEHWEGQGKRNDLVASLEPIFSSSQDDYELRHLLDLYFDSLLKVKGKKKAFCYLVKAQIQKHGWHGYMEKTSESHARLQKAVKFYSERADEFILESCVSPFPPYGRFVPGEKLVYFLISLGRFDEALSLASEMVGQIIEDTSFLPLPSPEWGNDNGVQLGPDIHFLLARKRSPLPEVRWWCIQELAKLLPHAELESFLHSEMEGASLETDLVELLCIFWLAKQRGYHAFGLAAHVTAKSHLSTLLLKSISEKLLVDGNYYGTLMEVPFDFLPSIEFLDLKGRLPKIYFSELRRLEERGQCPLEKQFAFEFDQKRLLYSGLSLEDSFSYYFRPISERLTGQVINRFVQIARSAFLRTLSLACETWGMPYSLGNQRALWATPVAPYLASLQPQAPEWFFNFRDPRKLESILDDTSIAELIEIIEKESNAPLGYISITLPIDEYKTFCLEICRFFQWEQKELDAQTVFQKQSSLSDILWTWEGWSRRTTYTSLPIETIKKMDATFTPIVLAMCPLPPGYLHSQLGSHCLHLPISTQVNTPITLEDSDGKLQISMDKELLGEWKYWNTDWKPAYPENAKPFIAEMLTLENGAFQHLLPKEPLAHFFVWEQRIVDSKNAPVVSYGYRSTRKC